MDTSNTSSEKAPQYVEHKACGLEARYDALTPDREPFLRRARDAARLTIPSLLPEAGHSAATKLYRPWQSTGARCVNNLASKLLQTLLPSDPFFRFDISLSALKEVMKKAGQGGDALKSDLDEALSLYEKEIMTEIETGTIRVSAFEAMLHAIVPGNVTCYLPKEGGMKIYHLDSYVCVRDPMGSILELIVEERLAPATVPPEIDDVVKLRCKGDEKTLRLHTYIKRVDEKFETWQEIKGIEIPGSRGTYKLDDSPFIVLRWTKIDGESYGRGHIESLMGDLTSLEGVTQAIVEGSIAASKAIFLVNPNGVTKLKTIAEAPNGAVRAGKADDVSVLRMDKFNDFRVALELRTQLTGVIDAACLSAASVQRQAERVTAEEIALMARELESSLGGVYSLLAQEFQLPLVHRLVSQMVKQGRLKALPKGIVKPTIVTGLDALSRGHDLQRLDAFIAGAQQQLGPEVLATYLNVGDYLTRRATALGLDKKNLIKSAEEVQAGQAQAQKAATISQLGPQGIKTMGDLAKEGMKQGQPLQLPGVPQ